MIVSPGAVALTAFSITASSAQTRRSSSACSVPRQRDVGDEVARRRRGPALHGRVEQRPEADRPHAGELRVVGRREHQQAVGDAREPLQLADDDVGVLARLPVGAGDEELGMPAGDRDRGAQQMRGVADELALALGGAADLLERGVAPVGVPHHRQEHGEHERDLGELVEPVAGDLHRTGAARSPWSRSRPRARPPCSRAATPEAVEHGQAHPDEVERHGLPVVPADHDGQVDRREGAPGEVRPAPGDAGCW